MQINALRGVGSLGVMRAMSIKLYNAIKHDC